jgi:hypothetical protein
MNYILLGGTVALLFFVLMRAGAMANRYERERLRRQAARWLAGYNYALMLQAQNTACEALGLTYEQFEARVRKQLDRPFMTSGQNIPMDRVPAALRDAARYYQAASVGVSESDWESNRMRQLESVLAMVLVQMPNLYADSVARSSGLNYAEAWNALEVLRVTLEREARARLGGLDVL